VSQTTAVRRWRSASRPPPTPRTSATAPAVGPPPARLPALRTRSGLDLVRQSWVGVGGVQYLTPAVWSPTGQSSHFRHPTFTASAAS
jgi:hypothetical protein